MSDRQHKPILHILNKAPSHQRAQTCREQLSDGDTLLLIENGVTAVSLPGWFAGIPEGVSVLALTTDMDARGIEAPASGVALTDYAGFVSEICKWPQAIYW